MYKFSNDIKITMKIIFRLGRLILNIPSFVWNSFITNLRSNKSILAAVLRRKINRTTCFLDSMVFITNTNNFHAQKKTSLYHGCYILNNYGQFIIGEGSHLGAYCYVNVCYGKVSIGSNVVIGPGTKIIVYSNYFKKGSKVTSERITKNIIIGNNVFIGANCSVLPGTIIHDNVVVGAGAVVKGELKSNTIYAGVPCKIIKEGWYE